jgi:hypothetical protein
MWTEVAGMALAVGGALAVLAAGRMAATARGVEARKQTVAEMDMEQFRVAVRSVLVEQAARERMAQSPAVCERKWG